MKLIAGLGNPGRSYSRHRHNIGFGAADVLALRHNIEIKRLAFGAYTGSGAIEKEAVLLAKPQTFMNLSGDAVCPLLGYYKLAGSDLIVVHDDIDIEFGSIRLNFGSGHGGHNGIRSIIETMGNSNFYRVRLGIGRPPAGMDSEDYVLSPFEVNEKDAALELANNAADAVEMLIRDGLEKTQQKWHTQTVNRES